MAYNLEEQEQLDNFKAFWSKWGKLLMMSFVTITIGLIAYYGYQNYQRNQSEKAKPLFEQIEKTVITITQAMDVDLKEKIESKPGTQFNSKVNTKDVQLINDLAKKLIQQYPNTAQAQLGALLSAKTQANLGKDTESQYLWQWLIDHAKDPEYSYLARLYLATAWFDARQLDKALALLTIQDGSKAFKAFELLYVDRRGDILVELNKQPQAIVEYQQAWNLSEKNPNLRDLIDQKMQLLGKNPNQSNAISTNSIN